MKKSDDPLLLCPFRLSERHKKQIAERGGVSYLRRLLDSDAGIQASAIQSETSAIQSETSAIQNVVSSTSAIQKTPKPRASAIQKSSTGQTSAIQSPILTPTAIQSIPADKPNYRLLKHPRYRGIDPFEDGISETGRTARMKLYIDWLRRQGLI
jgi:hypothetical protein